MARAGAKEVAKRAKVVRIFEYADLSLYAGPEFPVDSVRTSRFETALKWCGTARVVSGLHDSG